jgi:hypothetical protein
MIGMRSEVVEASGVEHADGLLNLAVFVDLAYDFDRRSGADFAYGASERTSLLLMPRLDYEVTDNFQIQAGIGVDFTAADTVPLPSVRVICSQ